MILNLVAAEPLQNRKSTLRGVRQSRCEIALSLQNASLRSSDPCPATNIGG